jgi:hypothetical protein
MSPYDFKQNICFNHENIEIGDLSICCEIYEFNSVFLIRNLRNLPSKMNNYIELFKLIYNETVIDVESYRTSLKASEKSKLTKIKEIEDCVINNKMALMNLIVDDDKYIYKKNNLNAAIKINESRINTIKRLIDKKRKFLKILEDKGNKVYFMKKICFRTRFYEVSELGITNSKELRYSVIYDTISNDELLNEFDKIKNTQYYNEMVKYIDILRLRSFYIDKFKNYDVECALTICVVLLLSIGMEYKNEILLEKELTVKNFIEKGESIIENKIKNMFYIETSDDWEKEIYVNKLINYIINGEISNKIVISKDYSASVFFNMVRLFSNNDEMYSFFNVGECKK